MTSYIRRKTGSDFHGSPMRVRIARSGLDYFMRMWRPKTAGEKLADKRSRRLRRISLAVAVCAVLLYAVAVSPLWHGRSLGGLVLPIPRLVPDAVLNIVLVGLALAVGCWASCSRANQRNATMVCQKCHRIKTDDGQTQCDCGGKFLGLDEMKWVEGAVHPEDQPPRPDSSDPTNQVHSLAAAR